MQDTLTRQAIRHASPVAGAATPRYDIYLAIHKGLRLMFGDTVARLGSADADDASSLDAALAQASALFDLLELHYEDEDRFVHPALERAQPGCTARIANEHVQHREALEQLRELLEVVRASSGGTRASALSRLYHALALYAAEDFEHMHFEDTEFNAVLWRHYSDQQIIAIEAELVASIPPPLMMLALRWIIPALNAGERAAFLGGARQGMPPEAFTGVLGIARETLPGTEWAKLARSLGVAEKAES